MTETTITTPSWVQALDKYVASKPIEDVAADLGLKPEEIIMLVANENPNGMSSKVKEAVATAALNLNRYPDADAYHLQKAIAEKYGVPQDWGNSYLFCILYYRCCAAVLQKQAEKAACGTADCF